MGLLIVLLRSTKSFVIPTQQYHHGLGKNYPNMLGSPLTTRGDASHDRFTSTALKYHSSGDGGEVDRDMALLNKRIQVLKVDILEEEVRRSNNPALDPYDVVEEVLHGLLHYDDPLPDAGFRFMLRSSTLEWKSAIRQSVGAPNDASEDLVASALGDAIGRPHNHFGILVGTKDAEKYKLVFRKEFDDESFMLEGSYHDRGADQKYDKNYEDGDENSTFYLECELRGKEDDELLVIMGWQLQKKHIDGSAWFVHRIDWQDFRLRFRPGIGREDW
eukprot:CAMPEP_0195285302 /NCGR_PEP_ID=MMETSP0707-20130614/3184_1 /TAXON_ID=33640 /ORGANISM="Asterionellopsis glacialis, Strain CCMP134" /LENGTH=273 /DNA_ID=CAMNT_0040344775 /DNA_START=294 /DNA_END=1112 /DNA_ORIENTATION=-